jgi:hypothetical protein
MRWETASRFCLEAPGRGCVACPAPEVRVSVNLLSLNTAAAARSKGLVSGGLTRTVSVRCSEAPDDGKCWRETLNGLGSGAGSFSLSLFGKKKRRFILTAEAVFR